MKARDLALILALHPDHEVQIRGGGTWLPLEAKDVEITTDMLLASGDYGPVVNLG